MTREDNETIVGKHEKQLGIEYIREKYCLVSSRRVTVYHFAKHPDHVADIVSGGFKAISRHQLHFSFTPNLLEYPKDRLLAIDFDTTPTKPLTILDLTKIPRGSRAAAEEYSRIVRVLGSSVNDRDSCIRIGFPGYVDSCEADDRVWFGDSRELVLYDFDHMSRIRRPNDEEIKSILDRCSGK